MSTVLATIAFVILVWWTGTALVLVLQHRIHVSDSPWFRAVLLSTSLLGVFALYLSAGSLQWFSVAVAFVAAVTLWGCLELSYYLGLITGTHCQPCTPGLTEWQRFRQALSASIWHELLIVGVGIGLIMLLAARDNPAGLYTFLVLWLMRWSAKINLFFGVPHFSTDWFPQRLAYLDSYLRRAPLSYCYVVTMSLASVGLIALIIAATRSEGSLSLVYGLPATLLALAIVEHICMALPIADSRLWHHARELSAPKRRVVS